MNRKRSKSSRSQPRRGSILIVSLVCLLVVMSLLGHMLLAAVRNGRQLHTERDHRQCELLLQAGVDRGLRQLAADAAYKGDVHEVAPEEIIGQASGRITIEVSRPSGSQISHLNITAEYPLGTVPSIRRSRQLQLQANPRPAQE
ncbi:hypothetical protein NA78x_003929 [Anatilimnocola sp. NA78]|uniref:hypothetical protein n=1 Tax=Anatilimnocola sp. NA78 TaxID=3415683 RepID=UPI003CE4DA21